MGNKDLIGGGIFTALGVLIFILTFGFPTLEKGHPGPSLFPRILAVLFIFFAGIVLLRGWRTRVETLQSAPEEDFEVPRNYFSPIFVLILIVVYMTLSNWLGFFITSTLILFLMMIKLGVPYLRSVVISILLTLFVNLMFYKILRVPLPMGFLGW
jgi:putative tricarboxylic transport membrane protein